MREGELRRKLIDDLSGKGVTMVSMGMGTFDCYVPDRCCFVELKRLDWNPRYQRPTIEFSISQTETMKLLPEPPYVIAFANDPERYYLLNPDIIAQRLSTRKQYHTMWITEDKLYVPKIASYPDLLDACTIAFRSPIVPTVFGS